MATFSTPDIYHALGGALEQLLAAMTNGALECAGKRSTDLDEQYGAEAFDLLVDAWGSLLAHTYFPKGVYGVGVGVGVGGAAVSRACRILLLL
jgi:hypothetical protein